jgi:phosphopantetheinyl transferase (holo-ACP synthase)
VDIERIEACDAAFADLICLPRERPDPACVNDPDAYLTELWCSKEALSKALGDALDYAPARLASPMLWREGRAGPWRATRLEAPPRHTAWLCWRAGSAHS